MQISRLAILTTIIALGGCFDHADREPNPYMEESLWLCKPGIANDRCAALNQDRTDILSDTSLNTVQHIANPNARFDCFYVAPTVDLREEPGNTEDLSDDTPFLFPLVNQAARFNSMCRMYAPLYHQMTIGTYAVEGGYRSTEFFTRAYNDVDNAFQQYLDESDQRRFVLMGHSQGSHMLIELIQRHIDNNPELRSRMVSALLLGPVGVLQNDSFDNVPFCSHATDTGCVVAYDSIAAGGIANRVMPVTPRPCVNPTLLGGTPGVLANSIWQVDSGFPFPEGISTPWVGNPELYTAECEADGYLGIGVVEGKTAPFSPQIVQLVLGGDDLHNTDANYPMGDLLRIVEVQADNH